MLNSPNALKILRSGQLLKFSGELSCPKISPGKFSWSSDR